MMKMMMLMLMMLMLMMLMLMMLMLMMLMLMMLMLMMLMMMMMMMMMMKMLTILHKRLVFRALEGHGLFPTRSDDTDHAGKPNGGGKNGHNLMSPRLRKSNKIGR
jgi:FlaA1/EpsC-like NDP-sugar epimerase